MSSSNAPITTQSTNDSPSVPVTPSPPATSDSTPPSSSAIPPPASPSTPALPSTTSAPMSSSASTVPTSTDFSISSTSSMSSAPPDTSVTTTTTESSVSSDSSTASSMSSSTSTTTESSSSTSISSSSSSSSDDSSSSSSSSSDSSSSSSSSTVPPTSEPPPPPSSSSSSTFSEPPSSTPPPPPSTTPPSASPSLPPVAPSTTFSSLVFVPTTDSRGSLTSTAPAVITTTSTSTQANGSLITITEIIANPTLSPDNGNSKGSAFFRNTGAVAGVFVLVGLAAASIILWILFAVRRRRRTRRIEHDTAVSATLAAAGFHRTPLDDDDDDGPLGGGGGGTHSHSLSHHSDPYLAQRRSSSGLAMSSIPSAGRLSAYLDTAPLQPDDNEAYNPYADYIVPAGSREGYVSGTGLAGGAAGAGGAAPPSAFLPYRDRSSSGGLAELGMMGGSTHGHTHSASGSLEPLLSYYRRSLTGPPSESPPAVTTALPPGAANPGSGDSSPTAPLIPAGNPPPYASQTQTSSTPASGVPFPTGRPEVVRNPTSSVYSSESTGDDRLDPGLRRRIQNDGASTHDLRDNEDYSRPVLGVRNPDAASLISSK
ncbi:unnamed protein product [Cyclocybe aegerita]|uniref:Uncharacterized protein n=1 Tax=Cyclocybe aegerita TaxID=1973307 RepID=A0A8S0W0X2_CYCAE|nr:unnamed protein product [Cyclocybe aegerita]